MNISKKSKSIYTVKFLSSKIITLLPNIFITLGLLPLVSSNFFTLKSSENIVILFNFQLVLSSILKTG